MGSAEATLGTADMEGAAETNMNNCEYGKQENVGTSNNSVTNSRIPYNKTSIGRAKYSFAYEYNVGGNNPIRSIDGRKREKGRKIFLQKRLYIKQLHMGECCQIKTTRTAGEMMRNERTDRI